MTETNTKRKERKRDNLRESNETKGSFVDTYRLWRETEEERKGEKDKRYKLETLVIDRNNMAKEINDFQFRAYLNC